MQGEGLLVAGYCALDDQRQPRHGDSGKDPRRASLVWQTPRILNP